MMTREQAFALTRELLTDQPEAEEKYQFLTEHTKLFWALLRCFLVGMELKTVENYVTTQNPTDREQVSSWMLEQFADRLRDRDKIYGALVELQEKVDSNNADQEKYEQTLQDLNKAKLDLKNMKNTVAAKDQMIKELQEKLKNVPTVGTVPASASKPNDTKEPREDLSLEIFKHEVLMNHDFSKGQKDYLLSLLEKGVAYSDISMIANPEIDLNEMRRFYNLIKKGKSIRKMSFWIRHTKK